MIENTYTKNSKPNFIRGDYLTGKDRSYERSLYRFEGFNYDTKKVSLRHICLTGWSSSDKCMWNEFTVDIVNDVYRLATPKEVNMYREHKLDTRQAHLRRQICSE